VSPRKTLHHLSVCALAVTMLIFYSFSSWAQIPVPQINLTGNIGTQGFPLFNSGTLILSSDSNHSMTAQETSAFSFKVTSTVSLTATRNLIFPSGKFPLGCVENATTGGQAIQVIGTSGTGVPIPNGSAICGIWNDGTNYIAGVSASGTVNSGTAFSPTYYPATGSAVSGVTPFSGFQIDSASAAPRVGVQADFNPFFLSPGPIGSTTPNTGSFTTVTAGSYAGNGANQTVLNFTAGTVAATPPAHTVQVGAPLTVTSSYSAFYPILAPTDSAGDVWLVPTGGGTGTWQPLPVAACGVANIPCINTTNTFTLPQVITAGNGLAALTVTQNATNGFPVLSLIGSSSGTNYTMQTPGLDLFARFVGDSSFAPNFQCDYDNSNGAGNTILWCMTAPTGGPSSVSTNPNAVIGWSSNITTPSIDTGFSRSSAGVVALGNGTAGNASGTLNLSTINASSIFSLASHTFSGVQGTTGANIFSCTGSFTVNDLVAIDANGNCVDSGILKSSVPFLTTNNTWTAANQFNGVTSFLSQINLLPATPATSSANISSPNFDLISNYWTGTATAADNCVWSAIPATGNNPLIAVQLTCSGSSGGHVLSIGIPEAVPSLSATGKVTASNVFAATTPLTFTGTASGVTVTCFTGFTCTSKGGTLSVVSTTFTTGTVTTLTWPATPSAPTCIVSGTGSVFAGFGTGVPTTTGFTLSNNVTIAGTTQFVEYLCQPNL